MPALPWCLARHCTLAESKSGRETRSDRATSRRSVGRGSSWALASLYNLDISENRDGDDLLKVCTTKMGKPLGLFFHHLWQDLAHLHLSLDEYVPIFGKSKARISDWTVA